MKWQSFTDAAHTVRKARHAQHWVGVAFVALLGLGIVADVVMVYGFGVASITARCWRATEAHPVLAIGGCLATYGNCWLVRRRWELVGLAAFLGGHLWSVF